jgi:quercetin dioxygenase-like cupin family protein
MQILALDDLALVPITAFSSIAAQCVPLLEGHGEAHTYLVRFAPGGQIGPHPAGFAQLFIPLAGRGWAAGSDGTAHEIAPGQAAYIQPGELHSKGSETGLSALMVQIAGGQLVPRNS